MMVIIWLMMVNNYLVGGIPTPPIRFFVVPPISRSLKTSHRCHGRGIPRFGTETESRGAALPRFAGRRGSLERWSADEKTGETPFKKETVGNHNG